MQETYETPRFKRGQRVVVIPNMYRKHDRLEYLVGQRVTIVRRSWERGAWWYTLQTDKLGVVYERMSGLRADDFRALYPSERHRKQEFKVIRTK